MAVKSTHVEPIDRSANYRAAEETKPSFVSLWLTGFIALMVLLLAFSIVNATTQFSRDGVGMDADMVLPHGSTMPGSSIRDERTDALDNIAGVPSGTESSANSASIDSKAGVPNTDRLPGLDDRRPQPVPAPL